MTSVVIVLPIGNGVAYKTSILAYQEYFQSYGVRESCWLHRRSILKIAIFLCKKDVPIGARGAFKSKMEDELTLAVNHHNGNSVAATIYRMALTGCIYYMWQERNQIVFQGKRREISDLVKRIIQDSCKLLFGNKMLTCQKK
ncbi:hypothetical protein H5410_044281 [Solanum commersonii]|uniref:Uncharacterized protein n=1 Tax=Solanum commersonii TaxID=4109 RepID=A0A9J5X819_SOLCO|nr:hypothetical protein H5410_044281 [Solanum commersonii]